MDQLGIVFAFDRWVAKSNARQFINARKRLSVDQIEKEMGFSCWPVANGFFFGAGWDLRSAKSFAPGFVEQAVLSRFDLAAAVGDGVKRIEALPNFVIEAVFEQVPAQWLPTGEVENLFALLSDLKERKSQLRANLPEYINAAMDTAGRAARSPSPSALRLAAVVIAEWDKQYPQ